jgi:molecular chaperone GrpE
MKECKDMTDEKSTKDPKAETTSAKDPATDEKSTSAKAKADKPKPKAGKEKKSTPQKPTLTQKEIDALIVENADLKANFQKNRDDLLLLAAEFENFKKRINKDQQRNKEFYKESMLGNLLPVIDDIDRALMHHEDDETGKAFTMIKSKLISYLEGYDVSPFDSVGEEFDPEKHDAMLTRAEEDKDNNIVLEEFEKGYMIGNKVLRHAKVIVNIIE